MFRIYQGFVAEASTHVYENNQEIFIRNFYQNFIKKKTKCGLEQTLDFCQRQLSPPVQGKRNMCLGDARVS